MVLFAKTVYAFLAVNYFCKKTPSYMFPRVLNLPYIPIPVKTIVVYGQMCQLTWLLE